VPKWTDFGNIWTTLREIDVSAIRHEAERPFAIACVGHTVALNEIDRLLFTSTNRYGPVGINPLEIVPLDQVAARTQAIANTNMLLVCLDARSPLSQSDVDALAQLDRLSLPALVVLLFAERLPSGLSLPRHIASATVTIVDPSALTAADQLADALLDRLPGEVHLAAARRLPGLRVAFARDLINATSFTNATYALATGLPEQVPILNIPFAAADIFVLTKNQAIMVYRLALAHGAPPEFQDRIREIAPVVGGGFVWRQLARTLISLVPVWGLVPKIAIAYGGTYSIGIAAWRWFANGEMLSAAQIRRLSNDAMAIGKQRARELVERTRKQQPSLTDGEKPAQPSFIERVKNLLPSWKPRDPAPK
jgi:uncharacterized protein (DUF697 family)